MLLAENENLPATDKSDQFLAFGYLFPPAKPVELQHVVAVPTSHRQMATMHLFGALLLTNDPHNEDYILES